MRAEAPDDLTMLVLVFVGAESALGVEANVKARIEDETLILDLGLGNRLDAEMLQRRTRTFGAVSGHQIATDAQQEAVGLDDTNAGLVLGPLTIDDAEQ